MGSAKRESFLPPLWVIATALVVGLVWITIQLRELATLLLLSYAAAYVIDPLVCFGVRKRLSRALSIAVVFLSVGILLLVVLLTALPTVFEEFSALIRELPGYVDSARTMLPELLARWKASVPPAIAAKIDLQSIPLPSGAMVQQLLGRMLGVVIGGYSVTVTLLNIVLFPVMVFYISLDFNAAHRQALALFPGRLRGRVVKIVSEIDQYVSAYVRGQLLVATILSVIYASGLALVGIKLWFPVAMIAGIGNLIPYVGTLTGILLASLMALISFGTLTSVMLVWGVFLTASLLEGFVITPRVIGGSVGLSPLVIMLALIAGGQLFGLIGIFLAIPITAVTRVLLRHAHRWALEQGGA